MAKPPVATVLVDCSKGAYIRSLARDLGEMVGAGAYLSDLVRTRSGPFTLDDAITVAELEELPWPWAWPVEVNQLEAAAARSTASPETCWDRFGRATQRAASASDPYSASASLNNSDW